MARTAKTVEKTRIEAVTVKLRDMILGGEFAPGQRVPEVELVSSLGVSRTPVRVALGILCAEGLLEEANRGFTVRRFTAAHVLSSFDVRGVLEGLACRTLAERGLSRQVRSELQRCLEVGESLIAVKTVGDGDMRRWAMANEAFHRTIIHAADLIALTETYNHLSRMPLASPVAILFRGDQRERAAELISQSHMEHVQVYNAIVRGESARAEALIKEHAYRSRLNIQIEMEQGERDAGEMGGSAGIDDWLSRASADARLTAF